VEVAPLSASDPAFARAWDDLADAASEPNVFAERWFVAAGITLPQGKSARILRVWKGAKGSELIGLFPFTILPRYGRLPLRHVQNWLHYHSFLGTPLLRAGHESAAWRAILTKLDKSDWAAGLLHVNGLVESGPVHRALIDATAALGRPCDVVHRIQRALLQSDLTPAAYYEATVRKKKRKELKRLEARLAEQGTVVMRRLGAGDDLDHWCDEYLRLEAAGWKGRAGSALAALPATERFFRDVVAGARAAERLEIVRLDLDGQAIAMLANLYAPPGAFSFKTAFDERFARFSPGVLVQLENLAVLERPDVAWMDSCAVEQHPMIDSLWAQRRSVVRVSVPLSGWRRGAAFRLARTAEGTASMLKHFRRVPDPPSKQPDDLHA
jgi:CelD/BcsL family acetyltransferase involved in cellulose biosynthesis